MKESLLRCLRLLIRAQMVIVGQHPHPKVILILLVVIVRSVNIKTVLVQGVVQQILSLQVLTHTKVIHTHIVVRVAVALALG